MRGAVYNREKHLQGALTTWKDAGWLEKGKEKAVEEFIEAGDALVGVLAGEAVALALSCPGTILHSSFDNELDFCVVSGINTAFHGRKAGFAGTLTAELIARAAERGSHVAGLGMFEQGFYDRVGFSNLPYWNTVHLRPSDISLIGKLPSHPVRLGSDHCDEIHRSRLRRMRCHGSVNAHKCLTELEMKLSDKSFVLGFRDSQGVLDHHIQINTVKGENGPMYSSWLVFRNHQQFRELMILVRSLGDQIDAVSIMEVPGISMQEIMSKPMTSRRRSNHLAAGWIGVRTGAWTQCRILDVEKCLNGMRCNSSGCSFNLVISDPVEAFLDDSFSWRGCGGEYTVILSQDSHVTRGHTAGLPVMRCSINTFTKLWNGSAKASKLPFTHSIDAPEILLHELDEVISLTEPCYDWEL